MLREWAAIILLLFGGFIVGVGWVAGLVLLWSSRAWSGGPVVFDAGEIAVLQPAQIVPNG